MATNKNRKITIPIISDLKKIGVSLESVGNSKPLGITVA